MDNPQVAYICDKTKCEKCTWPECSHTTDITYAANFTMLDPEHYIEKVNYGYGDEGSIL